MDPKLSFIWFNVPISVKRLLYLYHPDRCYRGPSVVQLVACWTTDYYHPCSNHGVGISEGGFLFDFASLPLEVARSIQPTMCTKVAVKNINHHHHHHHHCHQSSSSSSPLPSLLYCISVGYYLDVLFFIQQAGGKDYVKRSCRDLAENITVIVSVASKQISGCNESGLGRTKIGIISKLISVLASYSF